MTGNIFRFDKDGTTSRRWERIKNEFGYEGRDGKSRRQLPPFRRVNLTISTNEKDCSSICDGDEGMDSLGEIISTFLVKLILQVMGGTGAIWGFSEACGFRNEENTRFWRPVALGFGLFFFMRWLGQLRRAVGPSRKTHPFAPSVPPSPLSPLLSPYNKSLLPSYSTPRRRDIELQESTTCDTVDDEDALDEEGQPRRFFSLPSRSSSYDDAEADQEIPQQSE